MGGGGGWRESRWSGGRPASPLQNLVPAQLCYQYSIFKVRFFSTLGTNESPEPPGAGVHPGLPRSHCGWVFLALLLCGFDFSTQCPVGASWLQAPPLGDYWEEWQVYSIPLSVSSSECSL